MNYTKQTLARRLKLQQLAIFECVVNGGSIQAAARQLHMTQPALSKAIHEMESHFGQPLFTRSSRGVLPTDFGLMLRQHTQALMAELRYLADDLNYWNAGISGQVVVGSLLTASAQLLPGAIVRLRKIAPNVVVQVRVGVNEKMFPELARRELDVVVGLMPPKGSDEEFEHVALFDDTLCAVVGRQHALATSVQLEPSALEGREWIVPTSESQATQSAQHFFEALGLNKPNRVVESVSILTNLGLLVESDMIAVMPFSVARKFVHMGLLSVLPLGSDIACGSIGYTLARHRPLKPATQRFLVALQEVVNDQGFLP